MTTPTEPMDRAWLVRQTGTVILAAADDDLHAAYAAAAEVAERYGYRGAFSLSYALADSIARMSGLCTTGRLPEGSDLVVGFQLEDTTTGLLINPDDLDGAGRHLTAATRFILAYVNNDQDTASAIFDGVARSEEDADGFSACMIELAGLYGRYKIEAHRRGEAAGQN